MTELDQLIGDRVPHDCGPLETCDCVNPPRREPWKQEALRLRAERDALQAQLAAAHVVVDAARKVVSSVSADWQVMPYLALIELRTALDHLPRTAKGQATEGYVCGWEDDAGRRCPLPSSHVGDHLPRPAPP